MPDKSSEFAEEGTLAHALAADCLSGEHDAALFIGPGFKYKDHGTEKTATITDDMAREVQKYLNHVRADVEEGDVLMVEQRLPFFVGEIPGQFGTTDSLLIKVAKRILRIRDLKYGRGVQVYASYAAPTAEDPDHREPSEQLALYALGALDEFGPLYEIDEIELAIDQPRLDHVDEWRCSVADLRAFEQRALAAAKTAIGFAEAVGMGIRVMENDLTPGDDQCRFCKAKGTCPALRDKVLATVADEFTDVSTPVIDQAMLKKGEIAVSISEAEKIIAAAHGVAIKAVDFDPGEPGGTVPSHFIVKKPTLRPVLDNAEQRIAKLDDEHLALCMDAIDLVEGWCKAVRAEVERRLLAGAFVPGYKLVQGKQGNRAWSDPVEAEAMLKAFRLKKEEMYDFTLISPTTAEKLAATEVDGKPVLGKKQWAKAQALIVRRDGSPSVAPARDKRPALEIKPVLDEFDVIPEESDDLSDLI